MIPPSMPSFLPTYTVLPEDAYCSALDINSQEGDPRFPWQRDAAVQCDLKSFALPPAAAESSATEGGRSDRPQRSSTAPAAASGSNDFGARIPSNFFAPFGSTCAPTPPPRKSTTTAPVLQRALSLERSASRKKTSTLFSGTGAQGTSQLPTSLEEDSGRGGIYVPHHVQTLTRSPEGGSPPSSGARSLQGAASYPKSTTSPGETSSSLTRRPSAAERRKMCFVRKQTNSAPNSMDEDVPSPSSSVSAASTTSSFLSGGTGSRTTSVGSSAATAAPAPERPGYFNFDSMQRLLDLSMSVNVPGERKSFYLEIPSQEGES